MALVRWGVGQLNIRSRFELLLVARYPVAYGQEVEVKNDNGRLHEL